MSNPKPSRQSIEDIRVAAVLDGRAIIIWRSQSAEHRLFIEVNEVGSYRRVTDYTRRKDGQDGRRLRYSDLSTREYLGRALGIVERGQLVARWIEDHKPRPMPSAFMRPPLHGVAACNCCNVLRASRTINSAKQRIRAMIERGNHPHQIYLATGVWTTTNKGINKALRQAKENRNEPDI